MKVKENVAYLRGLAEGLEIAKKEVMEKLYNKIIETLRQICRCYK